MNPSKKVETIYNVCFIVALLGAILYLIGAITYSLLFGGVETIAMFAASVISFKGKSKIWGVLQLISGIFWSFILLAHM